MIKTVILWKKPPTFCSLTQRGGRCARNLADLGEVICFVSAAVRKEGVGCDSEVILSNITTTNSNEVEGVAGDVEMGEAVEALEGRELVDVAEGGIRVEIGDDTVPDEEGTTQNTRTNLYSKHKRSNVSGAMVRDAKYLIRFLCTKNCRRIVWNEYYENVTKGR